MFAWLPPGVDEDGVIRRAATAGVALNGLAKYGYSDREGAGGLIFGYGAVLEDDIVEGVRVVAGALAAHRARPATEGVTA